MVEKYFFAQNRYGRSLLDSGRKFFLGKYGIWLFIRTWSEFFFHAFQLLFLLIVLKDTNFFFYFIVFFIFFFFVIHWGPTLYY